MVQANAQKNVGCSELPVDGKTTRELALARCDCLIEQYLRWKRKNHRWSNLAQGAALCLTAMTPVVLLIPWEYVNIVAAVASAFAAIATGFLAITGWRENFMRYGYVWHTLQSEKCLYLARARAEYSDNLGVAADRNFASRIEQIVMAEVTDWQAQMQRLEYENRKAGG